MIIPTHVLSMEEVRERSERHHLEIAYLGDAVVGCSTVRPPTDDTPTATVIARVLAAYRGQGFGEALYGRGLHRARELGARVIETVVPSSNEDGLRFAQKHGFIEKVPQRLCGLAQRALLVPCGTLARPRIASVAVSREREHTCNIQSASAAAFPTSPAA